MRQPAITYAGSTKEIAVFGNRRLTRTSYGVLTPSVEAEALAARRRALVSLHSRGARAAASGKSLRASLLAHPLCWSNRASAPHPGLVAAKVTPKEPQVAPAPAPRHAPQQPAAPHHAQRPMYVPAGNWNTYLPWGAPGISRSHGPFF
jgi:hypothetical protein